MCILTTAESRAKIWPVKWLFGSVAVVSLFVVAHIVCCGFVFGPCFVMQYLVS